MIVMQINNIISLHNIWTGFIGKTKAASKRPCHMKVNTEYVIHNFLLSKSVFDSLSTNSVLFLRWIVIAVDVAV